MKNFTNCLWFDGQAEEAANFYVSVFKNSRILQVARYGEAGAEASGREKGSVMTVVFELNGQNFMALNGGPQFQFSPAISFMVNCETQAEVDHFWGKLSEGGHKDQCGWLQDRYGVSWQIVPTVLGELMQQGTAEQSERVIASLMKMTKLDINSLRHAFEQV